MFENIQNDPNGILRGLGKLVHEKNQKSKISRHCPFTPCIMLNLCLYFNRKKAYQIDVRFGSNQNFNGLQLRIREEHRHQIFILVNSTKMNNTVLCN
jgi:hypothetical protein